MTVTRIETIPIRSAQDDRPLAESHPNLFLATIFGSALSGTAVSSASILWGSIK